MPKFQQSSSSQSLYEEGIYSVEELLEGMDEGNLHNLDVQKITKTPPHVIAAFLSRLSVDNCRTVLRNIPELDASAILAEMDAEDSADIVSAMREWRALKILEEFEPDDAADVISELDEPDQIRLLSKLDKEKARKVRALLKYAPDTAGGIMTPNFFSVTVQMTADEAIEAIRKNRFEHIHPTSQVYVLDEKKRLLGTFTLETLILTNAKDKVAEFMETNLKWISSPEEDREKVALAMAEYNLVDVPVVDAQGRLLGIVEHDDIIDIIQQEATEDFQKLVGAGADEAIHDDISYSLKRRGPWLVVNLMTALVAAAVISFFQTQIESISLLAVFMQSIASLGGNTGAQTLAVAIRSMAVGDIEKTDNFRICMREAYKGILNGLIIGVLSATVVYFFTKEFKMALVVLLAMILNMGLGGMAGAFIPLILKKLGFDPAQSSSIFLTGTTDVCGFFIFLSLGTWLLF